MKADTQFIDINIDYRRLYVFLSDPAHLPIWAGSFCNRVEKNSDRWTAKTPMGKVKLNCVSNEKSGTIDYELKPSLPIKIMLYCRVVPNNKSCQLIVTHFQVPFVPDEMFEKQKKNITKQLIVLKEFMEKN